MSPSDAHVDDDVLSLLALGEDTGTPDERAHVAACPRCSAELAQLRDLVGVARAAQADGPLVAPAPHVWERIAGELALDPTPVVVDDATATAVPVAGAPGAGARADEPVASGGGPAAAPAPAREPGLAPVVPLRPRRWAWVAGAAAAGLVVGGAGAWWTATREPATTVVARAELDALPGWDAAGSAELETAPDGSRVLVVDVADDGPASGGYREVWLLRPDVSGLVSLGPLTGTSGRFTLPDDLDVDEFPVVDVSSEPLDGDPAHSGDSIVRGTLGA
ncbi:anti-sigma factor [Cellulomonas shaoxiangyii]|uniref:Anti-sigma factor n=1 Tax=Cellulomonas shaoxiangyii TaxID=2566013 RepID=A0A4P7SJM2_9CELL|nr:anti-sigma factor [Cellulomonas shaoxiangyii]QCB94479.1 anti-sigma factor [Cellulomonas shaoxiangyii]TGY86061.1 anti-sigma factor [Cellulomonas shaoxiangyii]